MTQFFVVFLLQMINNYFSCHLTLYSRNCLPAPSESEASVNRISLCVTAEQSAQTTEVRYRT